MIVEEFVKFREILSLSASFKTFFAVLNCALLFLSRVIDFCPCVSLSNDGIASKRLILLHLVGPSCIQNSSGNTLNGVKCS